MLQVRRLIFTLLVAFVTFGMTGIALPQDVQSDTEETTLDTLTLEEQTISELLDLYQRLAEQHNTLSAELRLLRKEVRQLTAERDELKLYIFDHEQLGVDFERYTMFKVSVEQEKRAQRAAELREKQEERKRRMIELRDKRQTEKNTNSESNNPLDKRIQLLRANGFNRIGDFVFVGQMGYKYKSEEEKDLVYSPWLETWYIEEDTVIDYTELSLSGSIVHAELDERNLGIAIAFIDEDGAQIGQTTVEVHGARPGVPYPFTTKVIMAADRPFKTYKAWVLFADPIPQLPVTIQEDNTQDDSEM